MSKNRTIAISTHWTQREAERAAKALADALRKSPASDYVVGIDPRAHTYSVTIESEDVDPLAVSNALAAMLRAAGSVA